LPPESLVMTIGQRPRPLKPPDDAQSGTPSRLAPTDIRQEEKRGVSVVQPAWRSRWVSIRAERASMRELNRASSVSIRALRLASRLSMRALRLEACASILDPSASILEPR